VALFRQNPVGGFGLPKALRWLWSAKMPLVASFSQNLSVALLCEKSAGGFARPKFRRWDAHPMPRIALISRATRTYDRRQAQECIG
jgi:hypothetical protein